MTCRCCLYQAQCHRLLGLKPCNHTWDPPKLEHTPTRWRMPRVITHPPLGHLLRRLVVGIQAMLDAQSVSSSSLHRTLGTTLKSLSRSDVYGKLMRQPFQWHQSHIKIQYKSMILLCPIKRVTLGTHADQTFLSLTRFNENISNIYIFK